MASLGIYFRCNLCCDPIDAPTSFHRLTPLIFRRMLGETNARLLRPQLSFRLFIPRSSSTHTCGSLGGCRTMVSSVRAERDRVMMSNDVPTHATPHCGGRLSRFAGNENVFLARPSNCRPGIKGPICRTEGPSTELSGAHCLFRGTFTK